METFIILAYLANYALAVDYCTIDSCDPGTHVACNNDGALGVACGEDAKTIYFDLTLINAVINGHNEKRNQVASGNFQDFKPAARMATLKWDPELAELAELNVLKCIMRCDQCRSTEKYPYAGQNLFMAGTTETILNTIPFIQQSIQNWFEESRFTTMEYIDKFPLLSAINIRHFTQMIAEQNVAIGCGAVLYKSPENKIIFNSILLACNYATANFIDRPVYTSSATPASDCKVKSTKYPNLCSESEVYQFDNWN